MTLPVLKVRDCRWIDVPGASDARGSVNFLQCGKGLDFEPKRLFFLKDAASGRLRDPRAHRNTQLVLVAVSGSCHVHLDDGQVGESVTLADPAQALHVAPWVWYGLTDVAPGTVVVVLASEPHDEADELGNYDVFKREAGTHAR